MAEHTEKQVVYIRQKKAEIHPQKERVWASSLMRRGTVSQELGRDTRLERSVGVLSEEELSKEVM